MTAEVLHGDSFKVLAAMEEASFDAVVCDPPYGLEFMNEAWDKLDGAGMSMPGIGERETEWPSFGGLDPFGGANPTCAACGGRARGAKKCECSEPDWHVKGERLSGGFGGIAAKNMVLPSYLRADKNIRCPDCGKWVYDHDPCRCGGAQRLAQRQMQEWHYGWAREAFRVLRPGGWLLAFGGSRTYHRLACAVEDAGFEVKDSMMWLYGCLSDDSEILTEHGWKRGVDVAVGERVAAWDPATEAVTLDPVEEKFLAPYRGPMVKFKHSNVDQLLTPNHRVFHKQKTRVQEKGERRSFYAPGWDVAEASAIDRWRQLRLPASGLHDGMGIGGEDYAALLGWVWTEGGFDKKGTGVRITQSSANQELVGEIDALLRALGIEHRCYERERGYKVPRQDGSVKTGTYVEYTWFVSGAVAERIRADLPGKKPKPTYELLWRMTLAEKRAFVAAALLGDGSGSTLYQSDRGTLEWFQTCVHLTGRRGQVWDRKDGRVGGCDITALSTYELQRKHLVVGAEDYDGDVWCVRVRTGAFVARRNGRVFVTGNSGFPKSLKVARAIDKHLGIDVKDDERWEREDHPGRPGARAGEREQKIIGQTVHSTDKNPEGLRHVYVPVTDEAKEWEDWGTALKPAHEPIVVGRKPLIGTVARNVLAHGTGALNIGAARIGDDAGWSYPNGRGGQGWHGRESLGENLDVPMRADAGRWPANVILQHLPDCADDSCADGCVVLELDAATGDLPVGHWPGSRPANAFGFGHVGQGDLSEKVAERGGASRFFYCAKVSRAERNAGLGDDFDAEPLNWSSGDANPGAFQSDGTEREAKNNHPTVKPIDVMRWLLRLSVRPGGRVLDPFAGSGSAGVAAELEGVEYVGVEKEERWVRVARARIAFWSEHGEEALDVMRAREQAERRRETAREAGQLDLLADAG